MELADALHLPYFIVEKWPKIVIQRYVVFYSMRAQEDEARRKGVPIWLHYQMLDELKAKERAGGK